MGKKRIMTGHAIAKSNTLNSLSDGNKAHFAAYLNMAQQNVYVILLHISKLLGIEEDDIYENNLYKMKIFKDILDSKVPVKAEVHQKAMKLLDKHFPFLKYMFDKDMSFDRKATMNVKKDVKIDNVYVTSKNYSSILKSIVDILGSLRNYYTHFSPEEDGLTDLFKKEKNISAHLRNCFEGGRRIIKDRFDFTENDMMFLTDKLRYETEEKFIEGKMKKVYKERNNFFYKLVTSEESFSSVGLLFFICLFIEKKYSNLFIDKVILFDDECLDQEKKIIREIFCASRVRLPKERMESQSDKMALALDMLNELQKCPSELFDTFSKDDKDKFRVYSNINDSSERNGDESEENQVLMLRYHDRFPRLAMRYIDECEIFDKIRFQVSLGNYRYAFYNKQCIDSTEEDRVRSLQKELNGFGRLKEIEQERKERWKSLIRPIEQVRKEKISSDPYITEHYASYIINGNRIGMWFDLNNSQDTQESPVMLIPALPENPKSHDLRNKQKQGSKIAEKTAPLCWLSIYELPALLFHYLLSEDKKQSENIIINCVSRYHKLFNDIKNGKLMPSTKQKSEDILKNQYQLNLVDIPQKLQDYLEGKEINIDEQFEKRAKERLERMIQSTEYRLENFKEERNMLGSKDNKIGKKDYVDIRSGHLAGYLSKDILFFQPVNKNNNNKATGLNFQILQSSLALFSKGKPLDELIHIFEAANLLGEKKAHPFLKEVLNSKPCDIFNFYQQYLIAKINGLKACLSIGKFNQYYFLYPDRKKWGDRTSDYYKELAGRYLMETFRENESYKSIELPRQLFEEPVKQLLRKKFGNNPEMKRVLEQEECNITYLISEYFRIVKGNDKNQEFYYPTENAYMRSYRLFNLLNNKIERNKLVEVSYNPTLIQYMNGELATLRYKEALSRELELSKAKISNNFTLDNYQKKWKMRNLQKQYEEDIEAAPFRIKKALSEFKKNEKYIRRYKIQDILLFLMSKNILTENNVNDTNAAMSDIEDFKLCNIKPIKQGETGNNNNILTIEISFSIELLLKNGEKFIIKQDNLKLKNYGDFYRFIYDRRIKSLLPYIKDARVIERTFLENELDSYDSQRSTIFKIVHLFEKSIISKYQELINPKSEEYYFTSYYGKKIPKRINFGELVKLSDAIQTEDKNIMIEIRNSFGHNRYANNIEIDKNSLPEIANSIEVLFEKIVKKDISDIDI